MSFDFSQIPHRRFNPLTGEWILVSPHRAERPWHGSQEPVVSEEMPEYDPECYLCPGNRRASGTVNPLTPRPMSSLTTFRLCFLIHLIVTEMLGSISGMRVYPALAE